MTALGPRREHCVLIGTNSFAQAAFNFSYDAVHVVPPAASGTAYIERIATLIRKEKPHLVIPARDDDIVTLAALGERAPRLKSVLLAGSVASARFMRDKVETARFAARHNLPFAPTAATPSEAIGLTKVHGYPLIGKPRAGNSSRGVVLLRSAAEIERAFELVPGFLAQPFIGAPSDIDEHLAPFEAGLPLYFSMPAALHLFVQIIVGPDGELSEPFGCESTFVAGESSEIRRCRDPALAAISRAYARAAVAEGWKGPLNVQLVRDHDGKLVAHELAGRFTGGTAARTFMGSDEVGEVIKRFVPGAVLPPLVTSACDVVQNYVTSHAIPRQALATLKKSGKWFRPS